MAEGPLIIQDVLGNPVWLTAGFLEKMDAVLLEKIRRAITRPALIVARDHEKERLHYFRSAEWHETLLLVAVARNNHWELDSWQINPSSETLSDLLRHGRQLF